MKPDWQEVNFGIEIIPTIVCQIILLDLSIILLDPKTIDKCFKHDYPLLPHLLLLKQVCILPQPHLAEEFCQIRLVCGPSHLRRESSTVDVVASTQAIVI